MKSLIVFCLLFVIASRIHGEKYHRLSNLVRQASKKAIEQSRESVPMSRFLFETNKPHENDHLDQDTHLETREDWESGEDYYFKWAKQNRRPVEYLAGKKRDTNTATMPSRPRRIKGGIWRSGLVG